ncbi:MAG: serpin family protein [Treponema sp.]|nr:serpin family protein [Treponema sp.]
MKNERFFTILGLLFFLCVILLGCNTEINDGTDDYTAMQIVPVTPRELQKPEEVNPAARSVAAGANDFAFRLGAALAAQNDTTENMVCSPLSVWIPLTALVNAVKAQYKADLLTALGMPDIAEADINNGVSRMLYDLTRQRYKEYGQENYHEPIKIANAVFVDHDKTIKVDFAQAFMDYYRGSSIQVDFESPAAVAEVNDWVDKNTKGMIRNIIQEFDPATLAVLANAIYFFDRWDWEFNPAKTEPDTFYAPQGETEAFYMLREGDGQVYFEDKKLQALPLEFTTGGGLYILLPKDGDAAGLLASLTNDYFLAIQNGSSPAEGKLLLPRFSVEGDVMRLKDTLKAMDIPLFNDDSLTGLIKEENVRISDALHKAVIEVDEKGTTAAAVTIFSMDATSAGPEPPGEPFEMNCNKPFVFILYDHTHDGGMQVVFTGMVNRP